VRQMHLVVVLVVLVGLPVGASSQSSATLDQIEQLERAGRTEEARQGLLRWWDDQYADASRLDVQRGLWLRARLTVDPGQASLDYRRLVVEYPGGPYADLALFRLAQGAFALGDSASARQSFERLQRDYVGSAVAREAAEWWADRGPLPTPAVRPAQPPTAPQPPPEVEPDAAEPPLLAVQLGAFSVREGAESVLRAVRNAGFSGRIVRLGGDGLYRVRVGRFGSSTEAAETLDRLQELGFAAALVRDARLERPIGR
jgi:hypothetical protein